MLAAGVLLMAFGLITGRGFSGIAALSGSGGSVTRGATYTHTENPDGSRETRTSTWSKRKE